MSYYHQPPYPPYGSPPPGSGYPPPPLPPHPGFSPPPNGQYSRPPPPSPYPQGGFHGGPPPQGFPQHPPSPYGHPPGGPGPGYPPPGPGFAPPPAVPGQYPPHPSQHHPPQGPPSFPSPGYVPGQMAPGDFRLAADQLRKAMKGFGTDEKALIQVLSKLDPLQMAAVRSTYSTHIGRDLYKDVKSETSSYFRQALLAIIDGPLIHDVTLVRDAVQGIGTKEWVLNDVLLGRSNADIDAIKSAYQHKFNRSLSKDVEDDLSFKTETLFNTVLLANRHEEWYTASPMEAEAEARTIHNSTSARVVNNVVEVCSVFARSSDNEMRAINHAFQLRYHIPLEKHVEKEFSGHMKDALLWMLRTATDPAMRDADALEDCMRGAGTKDEKLVVRTVRLHWNRAHLNQVKGAYRVKYGKDLAQQVRGETSGDYQRLMLALLE